MSIEISIPNLKAVTSQLNRFPQIAAKYVQMAINRSLLRILREEKMTAPVDTGNLRDNWTINMGALSGTLQSNVPYSKSVEKGSRPHFPSIEAITPWARKRGINPWAVAHSIAKKGTKANPFMARAISRAESGVSIEFKTALGDIIKETSVN